MAILVNKSKWLGVDRTEPNRKKVQITMQELVNIDINRSLRFWMFRMRWTIILKHSFQFDCILIIHTVIYESYNMGHIIWHVKCYWPQISTRLRKLKIQDEIFSLEKKNNDNTTGKLTVPEFLACTKLHLTYRALCKKS